MKNKLIIMGIIIMIILSCTIVSYASTVTFTANVSASEVEAGDTFTVTLNAKSEDGINGISSSYTYDGEKLELVSATQGNNFANLGSGNEIALISTASESIKDADVFILTFKVKDGVEAGSVAKINIGETSLDTDATENSLHTIAAFEVVVTIKAEPPVQEECEHRSGYIADNGDGTHSTKCAECGETLNTENHTYEDGECICGAKEPIEEECEHGSGYTVDNGDGTHSTKCAQCGETLNTENHAYEDGECVCGAKEPIEEECEHTWGEYTDNNDGTHSATCTKCGEEHIEEHTFDGGVCEKCNVIHGPDDEDEENKKDETTANKEIPKAGLNTMLAFGVIAISIAIIMYRKNKKYEDIK